MPRYLYGKQTTVPSVAGMTVDAAKSTLASVGFRGVVGSTEHSGVEQGKVSSSSPAAGAQASAGAEVTLHPSSGPEQQGPAAGQPDPNNTGTVPNVVRMPFGQAQQALQQSGFQVNAVYQPTQFHSCLVYAQNPAPQGQAAKQSVVTIVVDGAQGQCH